jgi:hypothetical protein
MKNYQDHDDADYEDELTEDSWQGIQAQIEYYTTGILLSTEMIDLLQDSPESFQQELEKLKFAALEIERLSRKLWHFRNEPDA